MKRLIFIILWSVCSLSTALHAQNEYGKVSPHTADFVKYGNIPVSLYTGQVNVSVPLYHIEDPDFDIPLVLNYASDGFKPNKRPGWAGLNWSLSGAGVVTREIYGVPDDFREIETDYAPTKGFWQAVNSKPYNPEDILNFKPGILQNMTLYCMLPFVDNCAYDCEPDLFHFVMPGHRGSFVISNRGDVIASDKGYRVDLSGLTAQSTSLSEPLASQIKITCPDGYIYTFGGEVNSLEYSMDYKRGYYYEARDKRSRINAWHLTSVTAPNGRKLTLNYVVQDDSGIDSPFFQISRSKALKVDHSVHTTNPSTPTIEDPYHYQVTKPVFLESIVVEDTGLCIEFAQSLETCGSFYQENLLYDAASYQLDAIRVKQGNQTVYAYQLAYENKQHLRFLKKVTQPDGGVYLFDYLHMSPYPVFTNLTKVDDFGYLDGMTQPYSLLTGITYPTGGQTLFTYERHTYSRAVRTEVTNTSYAADLADESGTAGGFRIKKCENRYEVNADMWEEECKTYTYFTPGTLNSSGILLRSKPYYCKSDGSRVFIYNEVWMQNYNLEEPHIGYSYVTETLGDDSYIRYRFSDYQTCPDVGDVEYYWVAPTLDCLPLDLICGNASLAASKHSQRGYLLEKSIFDANGEEVQCTEYAYRALGFTLQPVPDPTEPIEEDRYSVMLRPVCGGAMAMAIRPKYYPVLRETATTYFQETPFVEQVREYSYNSYDRLRQKTETTSAGGKLKTTYSYPTDPQSSYPQLVERNIVGRVVEENSFLDSKPLSSRKVIPKILPDGNVVDESVWQRKGEDAYEEHRYYYRYDSYGNPVHVSDYQGQQKVYVWGYRGRYLIAEIDGVGYGEVAHVLGVSPESFSGQETPDMTRLDMLRRRLPAALITTYTYSPLVGVTSKTEPDGTKTTYEYNSRNQLSAVKDHNGKVIQSYTHHYKP